MSRIPPPVIGEDLFRQLCQLCAAARAASTTGRNYHAAALYVCLEALRIQAESTGSHVTVLLQPVGGK
jgi:hypothetical protein